MGSRRSEDTSDIRSSGIPRRTVLRGIGAGGLAVALMARGGHHAGAQEGTPAAGPADADAVATTIAAFDEADDERLVALCEAGKVLYSAGPRTVGPPMLQREGDQLTYWIAPEGDPEGVFPNLGLINVPQEASEGDALAFQMFVQGLDLGRTSHRVPADGGEVWVEVGYFGMYFGDPAQGRSLVRTVLPVFVGWQSADPATPSQIGFALGEAGDPNPTFPQSTSGSTVLLAEALAALDEHAGAAVVQMQVGISQIPSEADLAGAADRGFPGVFYNVDFLTEAATTNRQVYGWLRALTLRAARRDGYGLYSGDLFAPITADDIGEESVREVLASLPKPGDVIDQETLTAEQLVRLPWAFTLSVFPLKDGGLG